MFLNLSVLSRLSRFRLQISVRLRANSAALRLWSNPWKFCIRPSIKNIVSYSWRQNSSLLTNLNTYAQLNISHHSTKNFPKFAQHKDSPSRFEYIDTVSLDIRGYLIRGRIDPLELEPVGWHPWLCSPGSLRYIHKTTSFVPRRGHPFLFGRLRYSPGIRLCNMPICRTTSRLFWPEPLEST
jgi:hypothetical protein